ncbi:GSCFA domain-containing protein [Hymenobacter weizhouensis]|uniref:GSCFA domain-containing protein n=1 Tax=Hymenobacter sp. YIM 151500-1 TaxID=2987689 RepID=UPI0022274959|nr:GSCFA domain-containing protein [Hymenobacter sp. YIM 151500-1]UYZ63306.1 GSCFA domain-containing protein [Hymenobacter sp. YIM 151500-1]
MFRTELPLTPHPHQLPPTARVLTIGSCFSDSIGLRLAEFKVATLANPFGTVFNPISACKLLRAAAGEDMDWQQHLVEARGRWQSYDLHAEIGADSPVELLQRIQSLTRETGVFLATADVVVLTLGTAYAYRLRETQEIISNCHKVPAEKFDKELLTADEIIAAVAETHAYLRRINPRLRFVLTVSPVRHLKETLVLNSASKSMLRVACHYLSELLPDVSYFPAYELLLDDLRDYRFYAADMLHPSAVAEDYIWERFTRTYFDAAFGRFKKEWESIRQALHHRPLHPAAPEHRQFLESTLERLRKISAQADVRMELLHVERELAALPLPPPPPAPEPEEEEDEEERIDIGTLEEEATASAPAATLVGAGAGVLLEPESEAESNGEAANSPELAYEQAYTAALLEDETDDTEESSESDAETGEPVRKKKRRSRGGAKRTKRKQARLAAEAAAAATQPDAAPESEAALVAQTEDVTLAEPAVEPTAPEADVIYITEEELRRTNRPEEPVPALPAEPAVSQAPAEAEAESAEGRSRRNRNNRRGGRNEKPAGRNRQPLYAISAEASTQEAEPISPAAPAVLNADATPEPVVAAVPSAPEPAPEPAPEIASPAAAPEPEAGHAPPPPKRRNASAKPRAPRRAPAEPAAPTAPAAAETPALPTPAAAAPPAEATPAPAPRNRRRPAPQPDTPVEPPAPAAPNEAAPAPPATPARRRPARRPGAPAVAAPSPPEAPALSPAPPEPVPRRPHAPRRKPAPDAPESA